SRGSASPAIANGRRTGAPRAPSRRPALGSGPGLAEQPPDKICPKGHVPAAFDLRQIALKNDHHPPLAASGRAVLLLSVNTSGACIRQPHTTPTLDLHVGRRGLPRLGETPEPAGFIPRQDMTTVPVLRHRQNAPCHFATPACIYYYPAHGPGWISGR